MSRVNFTTARPVEYFMLVQPQPDGPVVGYFAGCPIAAAVLDHFGCRFTYAGVAPRLRSGRYDLESLRPGEWIVEPGLIYYRDPHEDGGLLRRLRSSGPSSLARPG